MRVNDTCCNGLPLQLPDNVVTADCLGTGVREALAAQTQPDDRGFEQFAGQPEIGHANDSLGIEHIPVADDRAASATFTAGETGLTVQQCVRFVWLVRIRIQP